MLTIDFDRLGVRAGERVLDLGCGSGRHSMESASRGAKVMALDYSLSDLVELKERFDEAGRVAQAEGVEPGSASASLLASDALALPFGDECFDHVIASEVLEHIHADVDALAELFRVLRPGGRLAVSVPAFIAERICWQLSHDYHAPQAKGGHVRIYTAAEMVAKLGGAGFVVERRRHGAHALHSPYWWVRCAIGPDNDKNPLVSAYHRFLVWDMMEKPAFTRRLERLLNPIVPKSIVFYAHKPTRN